MYKVTLLLIAFSLFITNGNGLFGLFDERPQFFIIDRDLNINDLNDVQITGVTNNQVIVFDSATGLWVNAAQAGLGSRQYTGLSPVSIDNDANVIALNILPTSDWNGLFDAFEGTDLNRTVLARCSGDANSVWTSANNCQSIVGFDTGGGISDLNISELGDVTISGLVNNQIIVFNTSTLQWENQNRDVNVVFVSTGFLTDFNNSDLNANGFLNILHDANRQYPTVTIFDSNELILLPDGVTFVDNDNIDVNLLSQTPIVGTWHVRIEAGQVQDENSLFIRLDGGNDQSITARIQFPVGVQANGSSGGCLQIQDTDLAGFTYCTALNGVLSCSTTPC